jgi:hypothetical protein
MRKLTASILILCFTILAQAQRKITTFESPTPTERVTTRILFVDEQKQSIIGEVALHYGQPVWKKEYETLGAFDAMTKGKVWRFGKDFWTTLDTNVPIRIGGKEIAPGSWYVGLHRSDDGATWSLAFIDPAKARGKKLDAFQSAEAPVDFKIPITMMAKGTETKDKLFVMLMSNKENPTDVTLKIHWGTMQLSAPVQVIL